MVPPETVKVFTCPGFPPSALITVEDECYDQIHSFDTPSDHISKQFDGTPPKAWNQ
jgi:hypothetical protein